MDKKADYTVRQYSGQKRSLVADTREVRWGYRNDNSYKENTYTRVPNPYRLRKENVRVAVLIGPRTGSSGGMTTISFIGRSNTRFFGLPSGGYTTANENFKLPGKTLPFLAVPVTADRTHKKHPRRIPPTPRSTRPKPG